MNYELKKTNYNNFKVFSENKLSPKSYFIPFRNIENLKSTDYLTERYNSDMITILNGNWSFKFYTNNKDLPNNLNTNSLSFDRVTVPHLWQFDGYEDYCYLNARYEFAKKPPRVPKDTPVGVYQTTFELKEVSSNEILTFLGATSNLEVYINGQYVGYSEGSHNTCEFDITRYLINGINEMIVLVYKWCNGSYLECQDMFRHNGIFRDVYLTHFDNKYVEDFVIKTNSINNRKYELYLSTKVVGSSYNVRYTILDGDMELHSITMTSGDEIRLVLDDITEWSAEYPKLYTLIIELLDSRGDIMCLRRDFGFKKVEIIGNVLYFNGKPIKFRGVNHHDTNMKTGYYMTAQDYVEDAKIMKEHNINAVRTSHYPPDPIFIMVLEHFGLYVMDEADIETHGMNEAWLYGGLNGISHNLKWKNHYWDRVYRMYERDKNSVAVVMWSLGNESGGYNCQDYCYESLKKLTNLPIHYEHAIHTKRFAYDVISEMYPPIERLFNYLDNKLDSKFYEKPYIMCEYAHAMGVGPGEISKYWEAIEQNDSLSGGFIWEFRDHAIYHENDKYPYKFTYGGDHKEKKHDSNFCVDGLLFPDSTPHTSMIAVKNLYSPYKATLEGNSIKILNKNYFIDSKDIKCCIEKYYDELLVSKIDINLNLKAREFLNVDIDKDTKENCDNYYVVKFYQDDILISTDCLILSEYVTNKINIEPISFMDTGENYRAVYNGGMISISKSTGLINSYKLNGSQLLCQKSVRSDGLTGLVGNLYKVPVDNYRNIKKSWFRIGLDKASYKLVNIQQVENTIKTEHDYIAKGKILAKFYTDYTVNSVGELLVNVKVLGTTTKAIDLPRVGYVIDIPKTFEMVEYYGYGDSESYSDLNEHCHLGVFSRMTSSMYEHHIMPQENGNRSKVKWLTLKNSDGVGVRIDAIGKKLNFSILPTTIENLNDAKHNEDIKDLGIYSLNIDTFVRGIGTNSCGPDTSEVNKLKLSNGTKIEFSFMVKPIKNN